MIIVIVHRLKKWLLQALRLSFVLAILIILIIQLLNVINSSRLPGDIKKEQPGGTPVKLENIIPVHRHHDNCEHDHGLLDRLKEYYKGAKSTN